MSKYRLTKDGIYVLNGVTRRKFIKDEIIDRSVLSNIDFKMLSKAKWIEEVKEKEPRKKRTVKAKKYNEKLSNNNEEVEKKDIKKESETKNNEEIE